MEAEENNKVDEKSLENPVVSVDQPQPLLDSPEQPLLGSVTTFSNAEGSEAKVQQIRSSARVFKKMKLDITIPLIPLVAEKNEKKEESKPDTKRCYRPLWTSDDKNIFFEALCEYGKDFENIQSYISNKLRKKGVPDHLIKRKHQVRHLYYRTWNKISKYLKFADGVKKVVQELYGLINYGELRKKLGSVREKSLQKLNELVYLGSTLLRIKGKSIRVKTPMCKALRHLNQLDEKYDEVKLPKRIMVELHPKDMCSFLKVQSMAQNPRLRTTLPLQKRLSNLIEYLNNKWKTIEARAYEKAVVSSSAITNSCLPPEKVCEATRTTLNPLIRLAPPQGCRIEIPSINISEYLTRQNICLNYYETRIGSPNTSCSNLYSYSMFKMMNKNNSKKNSRPRTGSMSDRCDKSPQKSHPIKEEENEVCDRNCDITDGDFGFKVSDIKTEYQETEEADKLKTVMAEEIENEIKQKLARIDVIRKGWTEKDCECLTMGELYLMFGSDSKLVLEYSWDSPQTNAVKCEPAETCEIIRNVDEETDSNPRNNTGLSHSLSQLLSIAKLHYRKNIIKCGCGHVCGSKNEAQLNRAVQSKIMKLFTNINKCTDDGEEKIPTEDNIFDNERFIKPPVYVKSKIHPVSPSPFYQMNSVGYLTSQINSIQRMKQRYCNRRGRKLRSRQVVVERKLPLLPNNVESGHQIVRMSIISQEDSQSATSSEDAILQPAVMSNEIDTCKTFQNSSSTLFLSESQDHNSIDNKDPLNLVNETSSTSPTRILKENDHEWIDSEVADYSLSSLLGRLESPIKGEATASNLNADDSRMSQDVDAQLRSLLTETSVDFSANFADLAEQVTNEIKNNPQ